MSNDSKDKSLEILEEELFEELRDFDNICTNLQYYEEVLNQSMGTPDEAEALDLYYDYQKDYLKQMKGLYESLKHWLDLTMGTTCVNINYYKVYRAIKDQRDKGII